MEKDELGANRKLYETEKTAVYYAQDGFVDREADILSKALTNKEDRILDLGCGTGRSTKAIFDKGYTKIIGVDYSSAMIKQAQQRYPNILFEQGDACALAFPDGSFDMVFFLTQGIDCIESNEKRVTAYAEIYRVLKPGGIFLHSAHNIFWLNRAIRTTWVPFLLNMLNGNVLRGTYRTLPHVYGNETLAFRRRGQVRKELAQAGFTAIKPMPSRNGFLPIFHPYWHFLAHKPGDSHAQE